MFRSRRGSCVLLLPLIVLLMGARQVPLKDPDPIPVPAGLSSEQVAKAVKVSLLGRGWVVTEDAPGRIVSTLNLRAHMAKIEVKYGQKAVNIRYLDSGELMYEEKKGERLIHRNYLSWVQNVVTDIARNLVLVGG